MAYYELDSTAEDLEADGLNQEEYIHPLLETLLPVNEIHVVKMPVYQVHSFCRHFEGFVRELRMMVTFLGFLFEPEFHGM
ncbi:hypothetical protein GUJ93_ZPchr0005g15542 [Zizania palustris]|uniref:Uncharacterized protein n=1 Tax=Zizania palustris TaxID=103762 RepID=A0A8J5T9Y3_ZIZPA|nr:hypothetical protein GUJ93_ZPchr0005g15542 [Zizania palustris]